MTRILLLAALIFVGTSTECFAQAHSPQPQGGIYVYPQGTTAWYQGLNSYRSGYYYIPPVTTGFYGPGYNGVPNYYNNGTRYGRGNWNMNYQGFYQNPYYTGNWSR